MKIFCFFLFSTCRVFLTSVAELGRNKNDHGYLNPLTTLCFEKGSEVRIRAASCRSMRCKSSRLENNHHWYITFASKTSGLFHWKTSQSLSPHDLQVLSVLLQHFFLFLLPNCISFVLYGGVCCRDLVIFCVAATFFHRSAYSVCGVFPWVHVLPSIVHSPYPNLFICRFCSNQQSGTAVDHQSNGSCWLVLQHKLSRDSALFF